jgi:hypothetical protein
MLPDEQAEREEFVRSLDALAGLMACFVAMDERQRQYDAWVEQTVARERPLAARWLERVA